LSSPFFRFGAEQQNFAFAKSAKKCFLGEHGIFSFFSQIQISCLTGKNIFLLQRIPDIHMKNTTIFAH